MDASPFRLLVVDDSEVMRKVTCDVLMRLGLDHVDEAVDGVEALRMCRLNRYDLVVTDLCMPRMNGVDLLRALRVMPGRERTAVFLASAWLTERDAREACECGVDGLLPKPFIDGPLVEQVTRLLVRLRKERQLGEAEAHGAPGARAFATGQLSRGGPARRTGGC